MKRLAFTQAKEYSKDMDIHEEHMRDKQKYILQRILVLSIRRIDQAYSALFYHCKQEKLRQKEKM